MEKLNKLIESYGFQWEILSTAERSKELEKEYKKMVKNWTDVEGKSSETNKQLIDLIMVQTFSYFKNPLIIERIDTIEKEKGMENLFEGLPKGLSRSIKISAQIKEEEIQIKAEYDDYLDVQELREEFGEEAEQMIQLICLEMNEKDRVMSLFNENAKSVFINELLEKKMEKISKKISASLTLNKFVEEYSNIIEELIENA